jgi:hypothetical protein
MNIKSLCVCLWVFGLLGCEPEETQKTGADHVAASQQAVTEAAPLTTYCCRFDFIYDITDCYNQPQWYQDYICNNSSACTPTQCQIRCYNNSCNIDVGTSLGCVDSGRVHCLCTCYQP